MSEKQETVAQPMNKLYILHIAIILLLMFGFGYLPPFGVVTPLGMKIIGIFLGLLYGWTTQGLIWPSLLGLLALAWTGMMPMAELYKNSYGNDTVVFVVFAMVFMAVIDYGGIMAFIANWFVSRKFLTGRPWLFTTIFLLGCYLTSALTNPMAAILLFWGIVYKVCEIFGYKPFDKWPTLMVIGVVFASTLGWAAFPFKILVVIILGAYKTLTGVGVDFLNYTIFSMTTSILCVLSYVLLCKVFFRPDMTRLKGISSDIVSAEALVLDKRKKILLVFLGLYVVLLLLPSLLPKAWFIARMFNTITASGTTIFLLVLLMLIRVDNVPLLNFGEMAKKSIMWDTVLITATIMPMATALTAEGTGIKEFMVNSLKPILMGQSSFMFTALVIILAVLLTNVSNNAVIGVIFVSITCAFAVPLHLEPVAIVAIVALAAHVAILTPVASPIAAMLHSNRNWVKSKDVYFYGFFAVTSSILILIFIGIPLANMLF